MSGLYRLVTLPSSENICYNQISSLCIGLLPSLIGLIEKGKMAQEGCFLKDPNCWREERTFNALSSLAAKLRVINDAVERSIALIEQYNSTLTKDGEQTPSAGVSDCPELRRKQNCRQNSKCVA